MKEGIFLGVDRSKDTPIIIEPFNKKNTKNQFMFGKLGYGMSHRTKDMFVETIKKSSSDVIIVDPKSEYVKL